MYGVSLLPVGRIVFEMQQPDIKNNSWRETPGASIESNEPQQPVVIACVIFELNKSGD
jgi:hypothetical protein